MTYETEDFLMTIAFWIIGIMVALIVISLPIAIYYDSAHVSEMKTACEAKNGTLLDHTTRVGKTTHHEYVCIDKNLIIEY